MGIGHLILQGALALVALWLTAELLLQNRAALHWRALALAGFLGVVAGMTLGSVPLIGAGAVGFALGQTLVTLSVKRGRPVGWSLRRPDGSLPGPLARVPLLAAATGGAAVAPAAVHVPAVGEVGPIEEDDLDAEQGYAYEEFQELDATGVYTEDPAAYQPAAEQQSLEQQLAEEQYYQQQYAYQQYQQQYQEQWAQPQVYGYDQYGQPVYQDPYYQQQYGYQQYQQQPYIPQQPGPQQEYQQQEYRQQDHQQQNWGYQQQV
ncbi:hypothetical protein AB0K51_02845 [Kitasatospora sp. NPDC049285]|uniref:hypothetical protein n=1 Tax=Kitasatospora sp. NPDC049285 TaxID=3157096 RepID=UPI0034413B64